MHLNPALLAPSLRTDLLRLVHQQIGNVDVLLGYLDKAQSLVRRQVDQEEWNRCWSDLNIRRSKCWRGHLALMAALDAVRCLN